MRERNAEARLRRAARRHDERVQKLRTERGFPWGNHHYRYVIRDLRTNLPVDAGDCPEELLQRYADSSDPSARAA